MPYGVLKIGDGYVVQELVEKPVERYYVNAGIYILGPANARPGPRTEVLYTPPCSTI